MMPDEFLAKGYSSAQIAEIMAYFELQRRDSKKKEKEDEGEHTPRLTARKPRRR